MVEAITNIPVHRVFKKTKNINHALDKKNDAMQRMWMLLGWSPWDVCVETAKKREEEKKIKKMKKKKKKKKKTTKKKGYQPKKYELKTR